MTIGRSREAAVPANSRLQTISYLAEFSRDNHPLNLIAARLTRGAAAGQD
jgi:hypothetical protein